MPHLVARSHRRIEGETICLELRALHLGSNYCVGCQHHHTRFAKDEAYSKHSWIYSRQFAIAPVMKRLKMKSNWKLNAHDCVTSITSNFTFGGTLPTGSAETISGFRYTCKPGCTGLTSTPSTFCRLGVICMDCQRQCQLTIVSGWASP